MRRRMVLAVTVAAATASVLLAGCGDGGDSDQTASSKPPHIKRANAICREGLREARRLGRAGLERYNPTDLDLITEAFVKPGIPLLERQAARLRRLAETADDPKLTAYVELYDPAIELSRQRVAAARKGDLETAQELTEYTEQLGADAQVAAREAGLVDCDLDFQRAVLEAAAGQ